MLPNSNFDTTKVRLENDWNSKTNDFLMFSTKSSNSEWKCLRSSLLSVKITGDDEHLNIFFSPKNRTGSNGMDFLYLGVYFFHS